MLDDLNDVDDYDGDADIYDDCDDWDGDGMQGICTPDTIKSEYKGEARITEEAVFLCAPKFDNGEAEKITIDL